MEQSNEDTRMLSIIEKDLTKENDSTKNLYASVNSNLLKSI